MWSTIILATLLAFVLLVLLTFFTRGTPVKELRVIGDEGRCEVRDELFVQTFAILTNTTFSENNRVDVLFNGDQVYERLWADLESAEDLITWHVFWFKPGRLADRLADILTERARAGVRVLFLYDHYGSFGTSSDYYDRLREAGVEVAPFRAPRWNTLYKLQQRMHVRAVVIDGRVGWTGGFAISDEWLGDGRHPDQWRDTSVRVEGSLVDQLQSAFASNWAETTGDLLVGDIAFPFHDGPAADGATAGLMYAAPSLGSTNAERFFMLSICGATERLYITSAYFVPDGYFRTALVDVARRGVDVRILTPGENTDRPSTLYAARAHYEELLEGGVRIWHYQPTMVHAKTLVADGIWAAVGTVNFDNRSMVLNDEVAVVARDERLARELEEAFLADLEFAEELDLESLRARSRLDRMRERVAGLFAPLL